MKTAGLILLWLIGSTAAVAVAWAGVSIVDDELVQPAPARRFAPSPPAAPGSQAGTDTPTPLAATTDTDPTRIPRTTWWPTATASPVPLDSPATPTTPATPDNVTPATTIASPAISATPTAAAATQPEPDNTAPPPTTPAEQQNPTPAPTAQPSPIPVPPTPIPPATTTQPSPTPLPARPIPATPIPPTPIPATPIPPTPIPPTPVPATPIPATPIPATPVPAPTTQPSQTRTFALVGGTTAISFSPSGAEVVWANPNPGFTVEIEVESSSVEVHFEADHHESRIEAWWSNGPQHNTREEPDD